MRNCDEFQCRNQQGMVLLLMLFLLTMVGAGLVVSVLPARVLALQPQTLQQRFDYLNFTKQRLLAYAAAHPELYASTSIVPGPGYFPCPSTRAFAASGTSCNSGGAKIAYGWLPRQFNSAGGEINLQAEGIPWRRMLFVLDMRYANRISTAGCDPIGIINNSRCGPLNASFVPDRIQLNGQQGVVALLIDAGGNLSSQRRSDLTFNLSDYLENANGSGEGEFFTSHSEHQNDLIVAIDIDEWRQAIRGRIALDLKTAWCTEAPDNADRKVRWYWDNNWHLDPELEPRICL